MIPVNGKKVTMQRSKENALELAFNALKQTDEAIYKFASLDLPEPLDCQPGCHYCCFNLPMVTPPEALLMGHHVEQTFTDQKKRDTADRINKLLERIDGMTPYETAMVRHELPCIFLEDGMCIVYEVRPVICRTCTSTSAEHCKTIFEDRNHRARLRCYQHIRHIFHTVHSRLVDRCREMGCQSDALSLAEAVQDYFRHSEPIHAWLQGETVFHIR